MGWYSRSLIGTTAGVRTGTGGGTIGADTGAGVARAVLGADTITGTTGTGLGGGLTGVAATGGLTGSGCGLAAWIAARAFLRFSCSICSNCTASCCVSNVTKPVRPATTCCDSGSLLRSIQSSCAQSLLNN